MRCPHCDKEITGSVCSQCGTMLPRGANYCMECGFALGDTEGGSIDDDAEFDLENRTLCPDGACTGIIIDEKCTECGKKFAEN